MITAALKSECDIADYARLAARPSAPGYCTQIIRVWSCRYPARLLTIPA